MSLPEGNSQGFVQEERGKKGLQNQFLCDPPGVEPGWTSSPRPVCVNIILSSSACAAKLQVPVPAASRSVAGMLPSDRGAAVTSG